MQTLNEFIATLPEARQAEIHAQAEELIREAGANTPQSKPRKPNKQAVSIRLSPDVLAAFRATGKGWQTRIDEALRQHLAGLHN